MLVSLKIVQSYLYLLKRNDIYLFQIYIYYHFSNTHGCSKFIKFIFVLKHFWIPIFFKENATSIIMNVQQVSNVNECVCVCVCVYACACVCECVLVCVMDSGYSC